jgi:hypothetical protein
MGQIQCHTKLLASSSLDADPWSIGDIGILDNNQLADGPGISQRAAAARSQTVWRWLVARRQDRGNLKRKDIMNREKILIEHWRWLEARGYKEQAASCKLQAASLTRKNYRIIKEYESKRSKTNNR